MLNTDYVVYIINNKQGLVKYTQSMQIFED